MENHDRISDLPRPILHHILSFLPTKDATKTSILSKLFNSTWLSFPIIDMDYTLSHKTNGHQTSTEITRLIRQFFDCIDSAIQRHRTQETNLQILRIRVPPCKKKNYRTCINKLIHFASEKRVVEIDINLDGFNVQNSFLDINFDGFIVKKSQPLIELPLECSFRSVKTLILSYFLLNNITDQITGFPAVEVLSLRNCTTSENFKLSSCAIRSVEFLNCNGLKSIEIESSSLRKFVFELNVNGFNQNMLNVNGFFQNEMNANRIGKVDVNLLACKFLQDLSISNASSKWVEDIIPKLIHLKNLKLIACNDLENIKAWNGNLINVELVSCFALKSIQIVPGLLCALESFKLDSCGALEEVDIEHANLRSLELLRCKKLQELRVHTPQLASFVYNGPLVPFTLINSRATMHSTLSFQSGTKKISDAYFTKLRDLVGLFDHVHVLTLATVSGKELIFPEEVREKCGPSLCDLKHLKVVCECWKNISVMLVDSLIWLAPRLETLSFVSRQHNEKSLKFQYGRVTGDEEDDLMCCHRRIVKCWKHSLKKVEIKNFDFDDAYILKNYFEKNAKNHVTICVLYDETVPV